MADNPLGRSTHYPSQYDPELLFRIERADKRAELTHWPNDKAFATSSFYGEDIWNAYELSWLNENGLPQVALGEIRVKATSAYMVESKSLKLYLNSLNQAQFASKQDVLKTIQEDLSSVTESSVVVNLYGLNDLTNFQIKNLSGQLIDQQAIKIEQYHYQPSLLEGAIESESEVEEELVEENLVTHLFRSNCLITNQPDWASIKISYVGPKISQQNLLRYLISFRWHNEFHEQCVERIYHDIKHYCKPTKLAVYARYTRRGGLDINPWRSDFHTQPENVRLVRQ